MLIIAGHYSVPVRERKALVKAHADMIRRARTQRGCLDFAITEDPVDGSRVNLMEVWASEADLDAWRKVAAPPDTGVQIEAAKVQKHRVSHSGQPF